MKNQTTAANNGIYIVATGAWTRAADFNSSTNVTPGAFTFIEQGTANGDTGWVLTTDGAITIGTTALAFTKFSAAGEVSVSGTAPISVTTGGSVYTVSHDTTSKTITDMTALSPAFGGAFTVMGAVTSNASGHNTAEQKVTVTIPSATVSNTANGLAISSGASTSVVYAVGATAGAPSWQKITGAMITSNTITSGHLTTGLIPGGVNQNVSLSTDSGNVNSITGATLPITGTLAVGHGGTGLTANPSMLTNLATTAAANVLAASPRPGVTGTLPVANGGTGRNTWNTSALVITDSTATGNFTTRAIVTSLGSSTTSTSIPTAGAVYSAISTLGGSGDYLPLAGGRLTGDLRLQPTNANYGSRIRWGDGDHAYIHEPSDDALRIHADQGVHVDSNLTIGGSLTGRRVISNAEDNLIFSGAGSDNCSTYMGRSQLTFFNANNADWDSTAKGLDISPVFMNSTAILCIRYKDTNGNWSHIARFATPNIALGIGALANKDWNTADSYNRNVVLGNYAMTGLLSGSRNVAIGADAGTYLNNSGTVATDANNSVFIGDSTYVGATSGRTNQIVIGYGASGNGSNTVTLGNNSIASLWCHATTISYTSDIRVKEDVKPADISMCLAAVKNLPVTRYKYKDFVGEYNDKHVTGFLADDVEKIFPKSVTKHDRYYPILDENGEQIYETVEEDIVEHNEDGQEIIRKTTRKVEKQFFLKDVKSLAMTESVPTLWGAVQCLSKQLEELKSEVRELKKQ